MIDVTVIGFLLFVIQLSTQDACVGRVAGYYADVSSGCQQYHVCTGGRLQYTHTCPNSTLFQQRMLICDHAHSVDCDQSHRFFDVNLRLGRKGVPFSSLNDFATESDNINDYGSNKSQQKYQQLNTSSPFPLDANKISKSRASDANFEQKTTNFQSSKQNQPSFAAGTAFRDRSFIPPSIETVKGTTFRERSLTPSLPAPLQGTNFQDRRFTSTPTQGTTFGDKSVTSAPLKGTTFRERSYTPPSPRPFSLSAARFNQGNTAPIYPQRETTAYTEAVELIEPQTTPKIFEVRKLASIHVAVSPILDIEQSTNADSTRNPNFHPQQEPGNLDRGVSTDFRQFVGAPFQSSDGSSRKSGFSDVSNPQDLNLGETKGYSLKQFGKTSSATQSVPTAIDFKSSAYRSANEIGRNTGFSRQTQSLSAIPSVPEESGHFPGGKLKENPVFTPENTQKRLRSLVNKLEARGSKDLDENRNLDGNGGQAVSSSSVSRLEWTLPDVRAMLYIPDDPADAVVPNIKRYSVTVQRPAYVARSTSTTTTDPYGT